jgi:hypothetical protein
MASSHVDEHARHEVGTDAADEALSKECAHVRDVRHMAHA